MSKKPFFKQKRWWLLALIVIALVVFLRGYSQSSVEDQYVLAKVTKGDITSKISANGSVEAPQTYNLSARTNAKILEVNVKNGDIVTKDQLLIKLDDTDLQNALKSAQYTFNSAVYARDKLKNTPLIDQYSINQAQQQVNVTWVGVENAKRNLNNALIKSPVNGKILSLNAKVDDYASLTSVLPLAIVASEGDLVAVMEVNELDVSKVQVEQDIELTIDALDLKVAGKVIEVASQGNNIAGVVTYTIKASIPSNEQLKVKMSVDGDILIKTASDVLLLPAAAIREKAGKTYVLLPQFDDAGKLIGVNEKDVEVGVTNNSDIEIKGGLIEGEEVVLNYDLNASSFNFGFGSTE
jgi:HlyD family secretion protein